MAKIGNVKTFALPNNNKFALEAYNSVISKRFVLVQYRRNVLAFLNTLAHTNNIPGEKKEEEVTEER